MLTHLKACLMLRNLHYMFEYITSEMNIINQLYSGYDQETLKQMRNLEGLGDTLVKHRGAHIFNLQCLHEKVIPSACKIKLKNNNFAESNIIKRAELALINNRIRQCNKKSSKLRQEITECKRKIKNSINNESFFYLVYQFKTNTANQMKKLTKLITSKSTTAVKESDDDKLKENGFTTSPGNHVPVQRSPCSKKVHNLKSTHAPLPYLTTSLLLNVHVTQLEKTTSLEKLTVPNTMPKSRMCLQN